MFLLRLPALARHRVFILSLDRRGWPMYTFSLSRRPSLPSGHFISISFRVVISFISWKHFCICSLCGYHGRESRKTIVENGRMLRSSSTFETIQIPNRLPCCNVQSGPLPNFQRLIGNLPSSWISTKTTAAEAERSPLPNCHLSL